MDEMLIYYAQINFINSVGRSWANPFGFSEGEPGLIKNAIWFACNNIKI